MSKRILVIGAGIAGLAAAKELSKKNFSVSVLEGRHRIGGRIHTDYSWGVPLELGASWIHGLQDNPIGKLALQFGIHHMDHPVTYSLFFNEEKEIISVNQLEHFFEFTKEVLSAAEKIAAQSKTDISLLNAINSVDLSIDKQSTLWRWFLTFLCYYSGLEINRLSANYFFQEGVAPDNHLITNGYVKIINGLAEGLDIKLNTIVNKIDYRQKEIIVYTNEKTFTADMVISTLPLGVLQNNLVEFDPPLPLDKKNSLEKLCMGVLNKIILKFPNSFWPSDYNGIYITPTQQPAISFYVNHDNYLKEPILTGFTGGQAARDLESLSDAELINLMMNNIQSVFGDIPQPEKYLITRWTQDPFSCGSYSSVPVGATEEDYDVLATPLENRLFFAGEATSKQFAATTQGAYLSGVKAAKEIGNSYA